VADRGDGDERVDEAICPVDYTRGLLVDDELRELFSTLRSDVLLTVIADSCHSGTVTRKPEDPEYPADYYERARWLDSDFLPAALRPSATARRAKRERYPEADMREIVLAGCADTESSYDALLGATYHGAMTHFALAAIQEADYRVTYEQLATRLGKVFAESQFASVQHPQLEGRAGNRARQTSPEPFSPPGNGTTSPPMRIAWGLTLMCRPAPKPCARVPARTTPPILSTPVIFLGIQAAWHGAQLPRDASTNIDQRLDEERIVGAQR